MSLDRRTALEASYYSALGTFSCLDQLRQQRIGNGEPITRSFSEYQVNTLQKALDRLQHALAGDEKFRRMEGNRVVEAEKIRDGLQRWINRIKESELKP
jgi:hypothetical protein